MAVCLIDGLDPDDVGGLLAEGGNEGMDAVEKSSVGVDGELPVGRDEVVLEPEDQQGLVGLEVGLVLGEDLQQRQHGEVAGESHMRRVVGGGCLG